MLRKNLTLEEDVNFLVDAAFCYHRRFPKVLDCTSGYQKGHVQQLSMGSTSFYLVIWVIHICWLSSGPGERGTSVDIHFLTAQVIHVSPL